MKVLQICWYNRMRKTQIISTKQCFKFFLIMYLIELVEWWNYSWQKQFLSSAYFWQVKCFHEDKLCKAACSAYILVCSLRIWGLALISKWGQGKTSISLHYLVALKKKKKKKKRQTECERQQRVPNNWGLCGFDLGQWRSDVQVWRVLHVQPGFSG